MKIERLLGLALVIGFLGAFHAVAESTVTFDNQSTLPALVKLIGPTSASVSVEIGKKETVSVSPGRYVMKVRYGTPGKYFYSKGDEFDVDETATSVSKITITLHKVVGGNYGSREITAQEFESPDEPRDKPKSQNISNSSERPVNAATAAAAIAEQRLARSFMKFAFKRLTDSAQDILATADNLTFDDRIARGYALTYGSLEDPKLLENLMRAEFEGATKLWIAIANDPEHVTLDLQLGASLSKNQTLQALYQKEELLLNELLVKRAAEVNRYKSMLPSIASEEFLKAKEKFKKSYLLALEKSPELLIQYGAALDAPEEVKKSREGVRASIDAAFGSSSPVGSVVMTHGSSIQTLAFSPDGKTLATGGTSKGVKIWDIATGKEQATLNHKSAVFSVVFSPDGKLLAAGDVEHAILWDTATLKPRATFGGSVRCLAFSPDGKILASGSYDKTTKLWNVEAQDLRATIKENVQVECLAFSPDGKTLVSSGEIYLPSVWDVATAQKQESQFRSPSMTDVGAFAYSPDGKLLATASLSKGLRLWDVATGSERATFEGYKDKTVRVAFSPDGKTLASSDFDKTVKLWDVPTQRFDKADVETLLTIRKARRTINTGRVWGLAFSPDGHILATGDDDGKVAFLDTTK